LREENGDSKGCPQVFPQVFPKVFTFAENFDFIETGKIARESDLFNKAEVPTKITLSWLSKHLSIGQWVAIITFITGVFIAGIKVGNTTFVRELLGYGTINQKTSSSSNFTSEVEPEAFRLLKYFYKLQTKYDLQVRK